MQWPEKIALSRLIELNVIEQVRNVVSYQYSTRRMGTWTKLIDSWLGLRFRKWSLK